jgi:D-alanine-D-alanine ligase
MPVSRKLRVLVLMHRDFVPPASLRGLSDAQVDRLKSEIDVTEALRLLGHEVHELGVHDELAPLRAALEAWKPELVFNLLEEFQDRVVFDQHVVAFLELMRVPYTGCNPRGLTLARDKALSKKILRYHRIPAPTFHVFRLGRPIRVPKDLDYPRIVKSVDEEASLGIAQASIVRDEEKLRERVDFVHRRLGSDAIAEQYIHGRELTISVLGNERLQTFPVWELFFDKLPAGSQPIATERAKWDRDYQLRAGIGTGPAEDLPEGMAEQVAKLAKRSYRALHLSGYARLDLRLTEDGRAFVIEANPNPDLRREEDFAASGAAAGLAYPQLLQRILNLGLSHRSPWKALEDGG